MPSVRKTKVGRNKIPIMKKTKKLTSRKTKLLKYKKLKQNGGIRFPNPFRNKYSLKSLQAKGAKRAKETGQLSPLNYKKISNTYTPASLVPRLQSSHSEYTKTLTNLTSQGIKIANISKLSTVQNKSISNINAMQKQHTETIAQHRQNLFKQLGLITPVSQPTELKLPSYNQSQLANQLKIKLAKLQEPPGYSNV